MTFFFYRIIHDSGFTQEDFRQYKPVVFSNTMQSIVAILRAMPNLGIDYENQDREVGFFFYNFYYVFFFFFFLAYLKGSEAQKSSYFRFF